MLTDSINRRNSIYINIAVMAVSFFLLVFLCSFILNENKIESGHKKGDSTFIFYSDDNQDKYEATFSDGNLISLSKNGKVLSKNEMKENEDLVYDNISTINKNKNGEDESDLVFHFNDKEFQKHMKHFSEEMKLLKPHLMIELDSLRYNFDSLDFDKNMKGLSDKLAGLKNLRIKILKDHDSDFDIPDIQLDEKDFDIDMNGINKELEKASEDIKKSTETIKNLDIHGLTERVKMDLKRANIDLKKSWNELKNLNQFLKDIKQEMVRDNLIKSSNDKINLKINDEGISVNGKKLPDDLAKKYKKMYKDKFGHNLHSPIEIETEE
jgi:hypothetical protein